MVPGGAGFRGTRVLQIHRAFLCGNFVLAPPDQTASAGQTPVTADSRIHNSLRPSSA